MHQKRGLYFANAGHDIQNQATASAIGCAQWKALHLSGAYLYPIWCIL